MHLATVGSHCDPSDATSRKIGSHTEGPGVQASHARHRPDGGLDLVGQRWLGHTV